MATTSQQVVPYTKSSHLLTESTKVRTGGLQKKGSGLQKKGSNNARKPNKKHKYQRIDIDKYPNDKVITLNNNKRGDSMIKKWFPRTNKHKYLQIVKESIYSITHAADAELLSIDIKKRVRNAHKLTITDATANVGGNTINFAKHFKRVHAVEINDLTCAALKNNIRVYGLDKKVSVHCASYTDIQNVLTQDVLFMDPPWGGLDYKSKSKLMLFLGDMPIYDIINNITKTPLLTVIKIPNNFDVDLFKQKHTHRHMDVKQYSRYKMIFITY